MQEENKNKVEAQIVNAPAETGNTTQGKGDYTRFFYRQIEQLWNAVKQLEAENLKLKNALKEAF